ncbi:bifunctional homocysteine S-methyltransferase/methylenetetrahydrofolate reductase [Pseudobacteriovorax antillogorgiicola]|uniref:Homocysteine S-methyltransferase n=1 Tax=Pseudobacteriovorax antillogorgiicola TaxID=1513793 RepID=A0A1Y6C1W8_9BACT|nr:bifunctional homocysteine S-methyltransferase/methylenetetrahydrofolate reductase [Pseudobacteriovorax antillogorgiicola]TCS50204.1 homocysteine S-methyltransferase [Pseudobacteriovorax antillogorgiicola]SMF32285.1 homocysteine S-methyltransferase [Pseudobacteriovorax antillogorgiicola]
MSARLSFTEVLSQKIALLFDGATGTELYNRGLFINRCFEEANLSNPNLIRELHEDYVKAGAQVLSTNSWGANSFKLRTHNLHDKTYEINKKAASIAREAIGPDGYVAGSVGPLGVRIEPWGPTSFEEAKNSFKEQIKGLVDGGVDVISLETFGDISELQQAILASRELNPKMPVIAMITINPEGQMPVGTPAEWAIKKITEWGVDALGFNCSVGPQPIMSAVKKIQNTTRCPIVVQPNAGLPKQVDGRTIYMCTPEYMAEFTKHFLEAGVQFVGGCCGTSPQHIKSMAQAFRHQKAMRHSEGDLSPEFSSIEHTSSGDICAEGCERVPLEKKSKWAQKIANGQMVSSVELLPPSSVLPDKILERSKQLKDAGVDAINIPDGPRASARMSAILTSVMIEQKVGIETVLHYTCRDRNLLGMQSDMMGAHAIGLRNMLLVTGDPPKLGNYPDATGVFDIDAIGLTNMVHRLNGGLDLGGRPIGEPTALTIGVGVNPVHRDFDYEMKRFKYKVEAGAEWAITQPVFDLRALYKFIDHIEKENIKIPIIAGIWPLLSFRNAQFMNNEVPGVVIPDEIMKRMAEPQSPEDAKKVGVEIAHTMVEELGDSVQGIQVSAPFGRADLALKVLGK